MAQQRALDEAVAPVRLVVLLDCQVFLGSYIGASELIRSLEQAILCFLFAYGQPLQAHELWLCCLDGEENVLQRTTLSAIMKEVESQCQQQDSPGQPHDSLVHVLDTATQILASAPTTAGRTCAVLMSNLLDKSSDRQAWQVGSQQPAVPQGSTDSDMNGVTMNNAYTSALTASKTALGKCLFQHHTDLVIVNCGNQATCHDRLADGIRDVINGLQGPIHPHVACTTVSELQSYEYVSLLSTVFGRISTASFSVEVWRSAYTSGKSPLSSYTWQRDILNQALPNNKASSDGRIISPANMVTLNLTDPKARADVVFRNAMRLKPKPPTQASRKALLLQPCLQQHAANMNRNPELPDQVVSRKTTADEETIPSAKRNNRSLQSSPAQSEVILGDPTLDAWQLVTDFDSALAAEDKAARKALRKLGFGSDKYAKDLEGLRAFFDGKRIHELSFELIKDLIDKLSQCTITSLQSASRKDAAEDKAHTKKTKAKTGHNGPAEEESECEGESEGPPSQRRVTHSEVLSFLVKRYFDCPVKSLHRCKKKKHLKLFLRMRWTFQYCHAIKVTGVLSSKQNQERHMEHHLQRVQNLVTEYSGSRCSMLGMIEDEHLNGKTQEARCFLVDVYPLFVADLPELMTSVKDRFEGTTMDPDWRDPLHKDICDDATNLRSGKTGVQVGIERDSAYSNAVSVLVLPIQGQFTLGQPSVPALYVQSYAVEAAMRSRGAKANEASKCLDAGEVESRPPGLPQALKSTQKFRSDMGPQRLSRPFVPVPTAAAPRPPPSVYQPSIVLAPRNRQLHAGTAATAQQPPTGQTNDMQGPSLPNPNPIPIFNPFTSPKAQQMPPDFVLSGTPSTSDASDEEAGTPNRSPRRRRGLPRRRLFSSPGPEDDFNMLSPDMLGIRPFGIDHMAAPAQQQCAFQDVFDGLGKGQAAAAGPAYTPVRDTQAGSSGLVSSQERMSMLNDDMPHAFPTNAPKQNNTTSIDEHGPGLTNSGPETWQGMCFISTDTNPPCPTKAVDRHDDAQTNIISTNTLMHKPDAPDIPADKTCSQNRMTLCTGGPDEQQQQQQQASPQPSSHQLPHAGAACHGLLGHGSTHTDAERVSNLPLDTGNASDDVISQDIRGKGGHALVFENQSPADIDRGINLYDWLPETDEEYDAFAMQQQVENDMLMQDKLPTTGLQNDIRPATTASGLKLADPSCLAASPQPLVHSGCAAGTDDDTDSEDNRLAGVVDTRRQPVSSSPVAVAGMTVDVAPNPPIAGPPVNQQHRNRTSSRGTDRKTASKGHARYKNGVHGASRHGQTSKPGPKHQLKLKPPQAATVLDTAFAKKRNSDCKHDAAGQQIKKARLNIQQAPQTASHAQAGMKRKPTSDAADRNHRAAMLRRPGWSALFS